MNYYSRPMAPKREEERRAIPAPSSRYFSSEEKAGKVTINQLLQRALEDAANPGFGDEAPEVMKAPSSGNGLTQSEKNDQQTARQYEKVAEAKRKAMEDEERKVAEMSFNHDELLPTQDVKERSKYIPLRLSYEERKSLRLINAGISVSDYTTAVDVAFKNKAKRHHTQLQHIVAFLSGIIAANNYEDGQKVLADRNFVPYEGLLQNMLEIARRYKITNPEKMRSEYGKLVFLVQDAVSSETKPLLGVDISIPVKTVYALLESCGGLALLDDPSIATATQEILPGKSKNRSNIQLEIKRKEKAAEMICTKYISSRLSKDNIRLCLYSISDNNSFLNSNLKPILDLTDMLQRHFLPGTEVILSSPACSVLYLILCILSSCLYVSIILSFFPLLIILLFFFGLVWSD
jgi:Protein of unknown function (DUF2009)